MSEKIMQTNFRGKVYSVGDGFCYEGTIKKNEDKYHFVIDCGSQAPKRGAQKNGELSTQKECKKRLDQITNEISHRNHNINLFILTHLHEDHFNGYKLLFDKTEINTIIMPYLYPEERLCLMIGDDFGIKDYAFLSKPYYEVLELAKKRNPEVELVLIRGINHPLEHVTNNTWDSNHDVVWGEEHEDSENILKKEGLESSKVKIVRADLHGIAISNFAWKFKLFNLEACEKDIKILKKKIGELDAKKLNDIVTDPTELANVQNKYRIIAKKYKNDINNTSIVVYHGPINCSGRGGSLITGDIVLRIHNVVEAIMDYYSDEIKKVGFFSIPHHGSKYNWTKKFIDSGNLDNTVCFASTHNYYKNRMTADMMSDLRCHHISALVVDENCFNEIKQKIGGHYHGIFKVSCIKYPKVIILEWQYR